MFNHFSGISEYYGSYIVYKYSNVYTYRIPLFMKVEKDIITRNADIIVFIYYVIIYLMSH
jgi:hypothetical protein